MNSKKRKRTKRSLRMRLLISFLVILFFLTMIAIYSILLYSQTKTNVIKNGELNAQKAGEEFEECLFSGKDAIFLAGFELDKLIERNAPKKEILDYLTSESESIMHSTVKNTTGIYACINGVYYDGAGWVPDKDYVPQQRPWYTEPNKDKGYLTVVGPYLDQMTNEIVLTLAKTLSDRESVVALDLSMNDIQTLAERKFANDSTVVRMVLNNNGFVVAHPDRNELGKNYLEEDGTLGRQIADKIYNDSSKHFEFEYDGTDYSLYAMPMADGWYAVSLEDIQQSYRPLRIVLISGAAVALISVIILAFIMIISEKRKRRADKLRTQLTSAADIYMSLCDLDIADNSVSVIKTPETKIADYVHSGTVNINEMFHEIINALPNNPTKEHAIKFMDTSELNINLFDKDTITLEYINCEDSWVRGRFVVSEREADGTVAHVLWMVEDIDDEHKEREALIDKTERATAANEAKSAFLSNMSHEIRTPINAILGMNEMIMRESVDADIINYSENIRTAGNTLLGLVNSILDFSKIEAGEIDITPVKYELVSMLTDLVNMVRSRPEVKERKLQIITEFDKNAPYSLYGDELHIKQVISNILTNAVKYTEKGSVTFKVGFEKAADDPNAVILSVSVKDTGIGIKEEDLERLFSKFERIEEKRNRNIAGTGLGMNITKSLLELMGSSLEVESVYGKGSVFSFKLRQTVEDWKAIGDYELTRRKQVSNRKKYTGRFTAPNARVLAVDDMPMNLVVFTSLLSNTKMKIDTAENGDGGIELARSNKYDIIFLDHMMPNKDGIETMREIRALENSFNADTPLICLTANAIAGAREMYMEAGFDDYMTKPIEAAKLEEMIYSYLPEDKIKDVNSSVSDSKSEKEHILPDLVFNISEINASVGIKNSGGSEKIYLQALKTYAQTISDYLYEVKKYWLVGDNNHTVMRLRTIRSMSGTIGAEWIKNLSNMLVESAQLNDKEAVDIMLKELSMRCKNLANDLAPLVKE